jgi:hypothetical protein
MCTITATNWYVTCNPPAVIAQVQKPTYVLQHTAPIQFDCYWAAGAKRSVQENSNMWGMLTADTFTPLLEFDFMGPDAWEALGKSPSDVASLGTGDKLDLRTKQVRVQWSW